MIHSLVVYFHDSFIKSCANLAYSALFALRKINFCVIIPIAYFERVRETCNLFDSTTALATMSGGKAECISSLEGSQSTKGFDGNVQYNNLTYGL
jgi:hypothetical protein